MAMRLLAARLDLSTSDWIDDMTAPHAV